MRKSHNSVAYLVANVILTIVLLFSVVSIGHRYSPAKAQTNATAEPTASADLKEGLGDHVALAPASIRDSLPLIYTGAAPSDTQKELIGPYLLMKSGVVDLETLTVTLPLHKGQLDSGEAVWYVLLDTNDAANAQALGINFSRKLGYADVGKAVRAAQQEKDATMTFTGGKVDFAPVLALEPGNGASPFPPKSFTPGSVGDDDYTPLIRLGAYIYNAPTLAFDVDASTLDAFCDGDVDYTLVHDRVARICPRDRTVTLKITMGFSAGHPVFYTSTDTNVDMAAAMESATYAPAMSDITVERDDRPFSAVERLFAVVNGHTGNDNPHRQGFFSAFTDGASPLNVLSSVPTVGLDYSPMWDVYPTQWTPQAIEQGYRARLIDEFSVLHFIQGGWLVGLNGERVRAVGIIVNCPVVFRLY